MPIRISALICTHNRARYLRKALQSLVAQTMDSDSYEILVIDNASTDETKRVVKEEYAAVSNLAYLHEPVLGLARARNTGWAHARGEYVAYLDDDAIACANWLEGILEVFESVTPTPGCVGGKIELIWEAPRPSWLSDGMVLFLSRLDLSESPVALKDSQFLAGANIAFPVNVLRATGGFEFGLTGKWRFYNDDILLQRRLESRGLSRIYHPDISVGHHIPASRLSKESFRRRYYWQGISDAFLRQVLSPVSRRALARDALHEIRRLGSSLFGNHVSPRRLYWHVREMTLNDWFFSAYLAGQIRQKVLMTIQYRSREPDNAVLSRH